MHVKTNQKLIVDLNEKIHNTSWFFKFYNLSEILFTCVPIKSQNKLLVSQCPSVRPHVTETKLLDLFRQN